MKDKRHSVGVAVSAKNFADSERGARNRDT
jgi:hypothetical protein